MAKAVAYASIWATVCVVVWFAPDYTGGALFAAVIATGAVAE